jgi:hypothetical protein
VRKRNVPPIIVKVSRRSTSNKIVSVSGGDLRNLSIIPLTTKGTVVIRTLNKVIKTRPKMSFFLYGRKYGNNKRNAFMNIVVYRCKKC